MNEEHEMVWRKILCMRTMTRSYAGFRRLLLIRGSRGFSFGLQKIHRLTAHFTVSALPFETGPLVSLLLRITAVQTSVVAAIHGRPARARISCLPKGLFITPRGKCVQS